MRRRWLVHLQWCLCIVLPLLVFVSVNRLVRLSHSGVAPADAVVPDDFSDAERLGQITDAFRLYAQAFENCFPDVDRLYGDDLMRAVRDKLKIPPQAGRSPAFGFDRLTVLQRTDPNFRYHGSGSRLGEVHRLLVQWSTPEGRTQVIFCDLSNRVVDARAVACFPAPWQSVFDQCVVQVNHDGSGTIVSADGLIVTADHVLAAHCSNVDIRFVDGRVMSATVVDRSKRFDVALLRIPVDDSIPFVNLGERRLASGEPAWVVGYGGSRSDPVIREVRTSQYILDELITTWNNVIGGDSGGALLDADGSLVGVILGPADPSPKTCRSISSLTLLGVFPILADPIRKGVAG